MFSVSIIGFGNRGSLYTKYLAKSKEVEIVAVCDLSQEVLDFAKKEYSIKEENLFKSEEEFFEKKRSDVLIIATLDRLHRRQAERAMKLGYDILLEKPVADNFEDTVAVKELAEKYGRDAVICHNLRYTPFYQKFKTLISEGVIGDVLSVEQSENVAYHHYMLSFVRGNWRKESETSPIILQKCCHDLDIIYWLIGKKCTKISSFGSLDFYNKQNRPDYATDTCVDCKKVDCAYNSVEFHTKYPGGIIPEGQEKSRENVINVLRSGHRNARCVFNCDNDVCDRQIVNMTFEGGITANLIMHGFAAPFTHRITKVYGTKGAIEGNINDGTVKVSIFGQEPYVIDVKKEMADNSHLGGDSKLVSDYIEYKNNNSKPLGISYIADSVYSHKLAFKAEESRLNGGKEMEVE